MTNLWASEVLEGVAAESPATFKEALGYLEILSEIIYDELEVNRVKTYLVRRSPEGPVWWLVSFPSRLKTNHIEYSPKRGLADYVIRTGHGLLATNIRAGMQSEPRNGNSKPSKGPVLEVTTISIERPSGRLVTGSDKVEARSDGELEEQGFEVKGPVDPESTLLYMPIRIDSKVSAVIGVSRNREPDDTPAEPLTLDDARLLNAVSPALALACQRCIHLEKLEEHFKALTKLGHDLGACNSLKDGYSIVASTAGELAEASCAVLLEQVGDTDRHLGLGIWRTTSDSSDLDVSRFLATSTSVGRVQECVQELVPEFSFRHAIEARTQREHRKRVLLLFDGDVPGPTLSYSSDRLFERYSEIFFQSACEALDGFVGRLGKNISDLLAGPGESETPQSSDELSVLTEAMLRRAIQHLYNATGVERVTIYSGREGHRVLEEVPEGSRAERPGLDRGTWRRLKHGSTIQEPSPSVPALLGADHLPSQVGSWQILPIEFGERLIGAVELFSAEFGSPVGQDHGDLAKLVAKQASWEVRRALRHTALERISHDLGKLDPSEGQILGSAVAKAFREWARKIFVRPECEVVLLARSERSGPLMSASTLEWIPRDLKPKYQLFKTQRTWSKPAGAPPELRNLRRCGMSAPIQISADPRLVGFVAILDKEPFEEEESEVLVEAARFLAVFLQAERERNDVRLDMGLFRHAALGAIQGLMSSGLALADMAIDLDETSELLEEVMNLQKSILRESEQLRLWRENQRFYLSPGGRPELRRRQQPAKPLLEEYLRRYEPAASLRGLQVRRVFPPRDLQLSLDERAFDVAMSNLLDNAVKYAFENREITLGMRSEGDGVVIWVEDIGHGIPEGAEEDIFIRDRRLHRKDPFRVIAGQGLGLMLVKSIIEAHDGSVEVSSVQEGTGSVSDTTPYRVKFTVLLPWGH